MDDNNLKFSVPNEMRTLFNRYNSGEITSEQYEAAVDEFWSKTIAEMEDKELAQSIKNMREQAKIKEKKSKRIKFKPILISIVIVAIITLIIGFSIKAANNEVKPSESSSVMVYVTRTGSKYHKTKCDYLSKSKIEVTLEEAYEESYSPCSRCKPPVIKNN